MAGIKINTTHHSVIYVSSEDESDAVSFLLAKQNVEKHAAQKFKSLRYIFEWDDLVETLDAKLKKAPADLVVLDTLTDFFGGSDFNNAVAVRAFMKKFKTIASTHNCLIIFNHHISKAKENTAPSKNALLGSMAVESKARVVLELRKDKVDESLRLLTVLKGNYIKGEHKKKSFVLRFDDNMLFSNTGRTVSLDELADDKPTVERKDRIRELLKEKKSVSEITELLKDELKVGRSTVGKLCKEIKEEEQENDIAELSEDTEEDAA
jgi:archaellum biogenesis ATPase FlaH